MYSPVQNSMYGTVRSTGPARRTMDINSVLVRHQVRPSCLPSTRTSLPGFVAHIETYSAVQGMSQTERLLLWLLEGYEHPARDPLEEEERANARLFAPTASAGTSLHFRMYDYTTGPAAVWHQDGAGTRQVFRLDRYRTGYILGTELDGGPAGVIRRNESPQPESQRLVDGDDRASAECDGIEMIECIG